jgi:tRNA pseudouridine55 synthase
VSGEPSGVLVVDKPRGVTSFDVVARVRRALGVKRVGHAGTLDPMATGVLPVCVGEATKLVPFLMANEKEYAARARLGVTTDTLDADGRVTAERDPSAVTRDAVERTLAGFVGVIQQVPPMHSALRKDGRRLYELARAGEEVERAPREVEIRAARVDAWEPPDVAFTVVCGKGTYIRSLAADLGEALGVGAHLVALRRLRVGAFMIEHAVPLAELDRTGDRQRATGDGQWQSGDGQWTEPRLLGLAEAVGHLPAVTVAAGAARDVRDGKLAAVRALVPPPGAGPHVRILREDGTLLAVCARAGEGLRLERVFC